MTLLSSIAHTCVGLSLDVVASVFGKHVHPTGHFAPIIVLAGSGIPELVRPGTAGISLALYSTTAVADTNKTRETIKRKIANPSI